MKTEVAGATLIEEENYLDDEDEVEDEAKKKSCCRKPDKRIMNVLVNPRFHGEMD